MARGFGVVPGGWVDSRNDWNEPPLPELAIPAGMFEVWIAATDFPSPGQARGESAYALEIQRLGAASIDDFRSAELPESGEEKAYVVGLLHALQRLPAPSSAHIYCRSQWIVDAISKDLIMWKATGRLDGSEAVVCAQIWKLVDVQIRRHRPAIISARLPRHDEVSHQDRIERLRCRAHGRKLIGRR